jgi:hypothetical protein
MDKTILTNCFRNVVNINFEILKLFHSRHAAGSERQVRGHQHDPPRNHPAMEAKQFARKSIQKIILKQNNMQCLR